MNALAQLRTARQLLIEMGGQEKKLKELEKLILRCIDNLMNEYDA